MKPCIVVVGTVMSRLSRARHLLRATRLALRACRCAGRLAGLDGRSVAGRVVRGFSLTAAQGAGMEWLAVSDLNATELAAFVEAPAQGRLEPAGGP